MVDGRQQNAGAHRTNLLRSAEIWVDHPLDVTDPDQSDDPFEDHHDRTGNPHFDHPHNDHHRTVRDCDRGPGPSRRHRNGTSRTVVRSRRYGGGNFCAGRRCHARRIQGVNHHLAGGDRHVLPLQRRGIDRRRPSARHETVRRNDVQNEGSWVTG